MYMEAPLLSSNINKVLETAKLVSTQASNAISFTRKQWQDNEYSGTAITASDLNRIEQAIEDLNTNIQSLQDSVSQLLWSGSLRLGGTIQTPGVGRYKLLALEFEGEHVAVVRSDATYASFAGVASKGGGYSLRTVRCLLEIGEDSIKVSSLNYMNANSALGKPLTMNAGDATTLTRVWGIG